MPTPPLDEIEARLVAEVATIVGAEPGAVRADAPLHTLGIDSMGLVEILVFIEKSFQIKLMESGLTQDHFRTLRSLAACIADELGK